MSRQQPLVVVALVSLCGCGILSRLVNTLSHCPRSSVWSVLSLHCSFLSREPSSCVLVVVSVLVLIHHHNFLFCEIWSRWALFRPTGHHLILSAVSGRQTLQQYVPRILFVAQAHSCSRKWLMLFDRLSCHVGSCLASVTYEVQDQFILKCLSARDYW